MPAASFSPAAASPSATAGKPPCRPMSSRLPPTVDSKAVPPAAQYRLSIAYVNPRTAAAYAAANPGRRGLAAEPGDPFTRLRSEGRPMLRSRITRRSPCPGAIRAARSVDAATSGLVAMTLFIWWDASSTLSWCR